MYFCPKCFKRSEQYTKFCPDCGVPIQVEVPPPTSPYNSYYTPQNVYAEAPTVSKAKAIVGMALSIYGFLFALVFLIYTMLYSCIGVGAFVGAVGLVATLPFTIAGQILCSSYINAGGTARMASIGRGFAIAGNAMCGVIALFSLIGCFVLIGGGYESIYDL